MKSLPESIADSRHLTAELLLTDIDLALTFLQTAKISQVEETAVRNRRHAQKAYDVAVHALSTQSFDRSDRESVKKKLDVLERALQEFGE